MAKSLTITFFPAFDDNIVGKIDPMFPGSFDGASGGLDPSGNTTAGQETTGTSINSSLYGDLLLFRSSTGDYKVGAMYAAKASAAASPVIRIATGETTDTSLTAFDGSFTTAAPTQSDRLRIYCATYGTNSNNILQYAWGEGEDASAGYLQTGTYVDYDEGSTVSLAAATNVSQLQFGTKVRYQWLNGDDIPIIATGCGGGGNSLAINVGVRGSNQTNDWDNSFTFSKHFLADVINTAQNDEYGNPLTSLLYPSHGTYGLLIERRMTGGFDINRYGKFACVWSVRKPDNLPAGDGYGYGVCVWTGTINGDGSLGTCMDGVAQIFFPQDDAYTGSVSNVPMLYEGDNIRIFRYEEGSQERYSPRYPQVAIDDNDNVFVHLCVEQGGGAGVIGCRPHSTDPATMSRSWAWTGWATDLINDWAPDFETAPFSNGDATIYLANSGIPRLAHVHYDSGTSSISYTIDDDFFTTFIAQGGSWMDVRSYGIKQLTGVLDRYEIAVGSVMAEGGSSPRPYKLLGVIRRELNPEIREGTGPGGRSIGKVFTIHSGSGS